ncbi:MAG: dipicolinate synthase subunit DpsA, partial [Huintestinicola sp.]
PLPVSNDGIYVNMPCSDNRVPIEAYAGCIKQDGIIFGGRFTDKTQRIFEDRGITTIDYSTREEFAVMNAIATAEGALQTIMEETPTVVSGQKILIIGMGRIAKALIQILSGFRCDITVAARKYSALAWAEVYGCKHIHTDELGKNLEGYSVIINTVPAVLLDREKLKQIGNGCLVIDLASKPGGVDFDTANALGIKVIWLLSLPGKAAPQSAGETIGKTISNILTERSAGS